MSFQFSELVLFRSLAELRSESTHSYAGMLWWLIRPLLSLCVYGVFFMLIMGVKEDHFLLFLFTGVISWEWFASATLRNAGSVAGNRPLLLLVKLNPALFPLSISIVTMVKFLLGLLLLIIVVACFGSMGLSSTALLLPILILGQLVLVCGVGMIAASITPLLPDFQLLLLTVIQLMMFLSGVFNRIDTLPPTLRTWLSLNPMALQIAQYRQVILYHELPKIQDMIYIWGFGIVCCLIGYALLTKFRTTYTKIW
ncbi:MAG: ABC transporter permease [Victivallales bacterium]|jgi:ABC-type polysaccharide/polyol phosphate export permease|nr:ABC transporter permease [Victivallales bacterium]